MPQKSEFVLGPTFVFAFIIFKRKIEQLKMAVSLENIAGSISCENNTKMTSYFRCDTITV